MNYAPSVAAPVEKASAPRHIAIVRITRWIVVLNVLGVLVSGTGILVSGASTYSPQKGKAR